MGLSERVVSNLNVIVAKTENLKFTSPMQKKTSDEQLILKYAKGEVDAFEQLYRRHKDSLLRYCKRQFSNQALAEECFQDIWMKVVRNREQYQPKALFTTYLYRIATNHVIDVYRKEKKRNLDCEFQEDAIFGDILNPEKNNQRVENKAAITQLRKQIALLPFEQKNTLLLKLDTGLSLDDISQIMGCGKETVKSRLRYATSKLKELLDNSFGAN
jgi:RNA polymerase sigma-70 factor, ECF subfamily